MIGAQIVARRWWPWPWQLRFRLEVRLHRMHSLMVSASPRAKPPHRAGFLICFMSTPKVTQTVPTLQVLATIKTIDLDMPSYDSISDVKASVGTVEGLAKELPPDKPSLPTRVKKTPKTPKAPKAPNLGAVLPSMNKSVKKIPKEKVVKQKPERKENEVKQPQVEYVDTDMPVYSENTMKEQKRF
mmetsp:Transcript_8926/g.20650  ORF Transcript_8926/g.20650 Transcript_8926/m.20650 type:complete len:185 (+) Transcript_8926:247-801(+)